LLVIYTRGRSRGRVQGVHPPPPPPQDEAFFFIFTFKICLPHQSVMPFLSGALPPKKNPGSAPVHNWPQILGIYKTEVDIYLYRGLTSLYPK